MAIEVELKAHIEDKRALEVKIETLIGSGEPKPIDKEDWYLEGTALVRLRREGGRLFITTKERAVQGGIETNVEHELDCDGAQFEAALGLFRSLGFKEGPIKTKRGLSYTAFLDDELGPLVIEVCQVSSLGWFVELEYLVDDELQVERARGALIQALALLEIDSTQIESRPYLALLS